MQTFTTSQRPSLRSHSRSLFNNHNTRRDEGEGEAIWSVRLSVRPSVRLSGLRSSSFSRFRCLPNGLSRGASPLGKGAPCRPAASASAAAAEEEGKARGPCAMTATARSSFFFERKCPNNEVGRKEGNLACLSLSLPPSTPVLPSHALTVSH